MISLQGKRIFISGAAAGMGYSVARLAAAAGAAGSRYRFNVRWLE